MTQCGKSTLIEMMTRGLDRAIFVTPFAKDTFNALRFESVGALTVALAQRRPARFRVALTLTNESEFRQLCRLAWVAAPVTLVLDEVAAYCDPKAPPAELVAIAQRGAHAGPHEDAAVSVVAIGQRPINLPAVYRSEVEHWYLFRMNSRRDRQLLEDDMGLSREDAEAAGQLPRFSYMKVDRFGGLSHGTTKAR